jgi:hypothetical protein
MKEDFKNGEGEGKAHRPLLYFANTANAIMPMMDDMFWK